KGPPGSGREALALALASALERPALVIAPEDLAPAGRAAVRREALWSRAAVIVRERAERAGEAAIAALRTLDAPALWLCAEGATEALCDGAERPVAELEVGPPDAGQRARIVSRLLAELPEPAPVDAGLDVGAFAARYRFGPGRWRAIVGVAAERARAAGGGA